MFSKDQLNKATKYLQHIGLQPILEEYVITWSFPIKRFHINEYLELRLDRYGRTEIFINGKKFTQCKYLLLKFTTNDIPRLNTLDSIDEAAETLDHSLESDKKKGSF